MVSFDIINLFINIPLERIIQIILDRLYGPEHTCTYSEEGLDDWCNKCKNRYEMKELLNIATKESSFIFNEKIYSQIDGVAMGSPLGPLFADIYINYIESKLLPRLKRNGVLYWRRFVDDTFVILKKDSNVDNIVDILNSFDNKIQFTVEPETIHSLPFLDIKITRLPNNKLSELKNNNNYDTTNNNLTNLQNNKVNNKTNNKLDNLNNNNLHNPFNMILPIPTENIAPNCQNNNSRTHLTIILLNQINYLLRPSIENLRTQV